MSQIITQVLILDKDNQTKYKLQLLNEDCIYELINKDLSGLMWL